MSSENKTLLKRYLITFTAGILITAFALFVQSFSFSAPKQEIMLKLANAFTLSGTLLLGLGCLVFLANEEAFLGLGYALGHTFRMLIPGAKKKDERYADYVERRREKGKVKGFSFIFYTGLFFMVFAVIFTVLYF